MVTTEVQNFRSFCYKFQGGAIVKKYTGDGVHASEVVDNGEH